MYSIRNKRGKFSKQWKVARADSLKENGPLECSSFPTGAPVSSVTPTKTCVEGARIVDVGIVSEQLAQGCSVCGSELSFTDVEDERQVGFSNVWHIR